jgi:hypothetical protein
MEKIFFTNFCAVIWWMVAVSCARWPEVRESYGLLDFNLRPVTHERLSTLRLASKVLVIWKINYESIRGNVFNWFFMFFSFFSLTLFLLLSLFSCFSSRLY